MNTLVLAGGCFWGMEELFRDQPGVIDTEVGYEGGINDNPTYENHPGHAEALEITYDPSMTNLDTLLDYHFQIHDPTTMNRQENDIGTQYHSAIFYHDSAQEKAAKRSIELLTQAKVFKNKIVTQAEPAGEFYAAEDYHQKYLKKNPNGYCSIHFQSHKIAEVLKQLN